MKIARDYSSVQSWFEFMFDIFGKKLPFEIP